MSDLLVVVGATRGFVKAAPVVDAALAAGLACELVYTGQHYDPALAEVVRDLELPAPDVSLGVGSASQARQAARVMLAFEAELRRVSPAIVAVVGTVSPAVSCALVASKDGYPVAHVDAGLRSFAPRLADEINRRVCDHLSTYLFAPSREAVSNLLHEGIPRERIFFVGSTIVDVLARMRRVARRNGGAPRFRLEAGSYAVASLHRSDTVADYGKLIRLLEAIVLVGRFLPVVLPLHPRTSERLRLYGLEEMLAREPGVAACERVPYVEFIELLAQARVVLTDSGGVQEEATALGVPSLTLGDRTEQAVTVSCGANRIAGTDPEWIVEQALTLLEQPPRRFHVPELWDGAAGERIVARLCAELGTGLPTAAGLG